MLVCASEEKLHAQQVTNEAPPVDVSRPVPSDTSYPAAEVVKDQSGTTATTIESDTQSREGDRFILDGNVVIHYGERTIQADHIEYDASTGEVTAKGHLQATGGANDERIFASHGTINVKTETGRFYDVTGSVGLKDTGKQLVYANGHPFLFSGRMVVKRGPKEYDIYDGTVTSCQLPHPDWLLSAAHFSVDSEKARASNSVFHLLNIPLLYLPYVTHPVDSNSRQSGLLLPVLGESSTKGLVLGEEFYLALGRSTDLTVGVQFFSLRGWLESGALRFKGAGDDFAIARYSGLQDRGILIGGQILNQGGQDVTFSGRHDLSPKTRVAADVEYLSSYVFREAFTENFNQAVSTDILSTAYAVHEDNGISVSALADRYQGLKRVATATATEQQVRIFHAPSFEAVSTDHELGTTHLQWSFDSRMDGLKRTEPQFATSGIVERVDVHPQIAAPFVAGGWSFRPAFALRDTFYSRSRVTPHVANVPQESTAHLNREDVEASLDLRPPVLERTFDNDRIERLFGRAVRHTIEPELSYRYVSGVDNFPSVLRFDATDVVSDTNELEYGVTQHLFLRPSGGKACSTAEEARRQRGGSDPILREDSRTTAGARCGSRDWISWRVAQKYFFDPTFGGAVQPGGYNILQTTLDFTGVAFLTGPRNISPVISRLRVRPTDKVDVEWNFDVDPVAKKFTADNVLVDFHEGDTFAGVSYSRLNAPGRSYSQGVTSAVSDFSQLRLLLGYGSPAKKGLGVAANAGLDLNFGTVQYGALQTSYNWDCCGFSIEYRKYELGPVRNENFYRFNFTLANIGTAGNLRRAERLF